MTSRRHLAPGEMCLSGNRVWMSFGELHVVRVIWTGPFQPGRQTPAKRLAPEEWL